MSKILKGLNESTHNKYDNNRTGFSRGPRDDERHDLDAQKPAREEWALKINGKVWSKDGKTVTFASKEQALKARQSLLAKRPELEVGLVTRSVSEGLLDDDIQTRMRMNDYYDLADAIQDKLKQAIQIGNKELIQKYSKERDDLDARVKQYGLIPESQLDELSNNKLGQYKTAAALDAGKADKQGDYKRGDKRMSGIIKATKKQFDNDEKKSNMDEEGENSLDPFKHVNPRVNNPKILGTQNRAKSIYHPPSKPNVKKLDKPLPENLGNELKSKSLEALQQVKQKLEQQRMADLEQWEKDFKQNTVSKFTAREPNLNQRATSTSMVAMPGEKHADLKARLSQLDKAIEKQGILDNLVQKLDKKGLLTPNIEAGVDTSMLARDGARDNYVELNKKLDKALEYVKNRLLTNKAAYAKPKGVDEGWSQKYKSSINCSHPKGFSQKAHCAGKKKHNESIEMEMVCEECGMCETHVDHENLDEACWKGYHKEGNKKMFGKTYPNCVKNTNEEQLDEKCWDTHKQVGMKSKGGKQVPNCVPKESIEEQHNESCPHCGGEMVSEELMNEKKDACYYKVKSRYKVWPSAYASGALVKCRNKGASNWGNGGKKNESSILEGIEQADESLHDWFNKEKWVRMDTKGKIKGPCAREPGEGKPKCLPQSKAHSLGKKGRASAAQRKRREDPNPERSGKAINVNTKKSNENVDEDWKKKLGAAALTGAMALGAAGANADTRRVTPDGQGGFTGGMKPTATVQAEPAPATPSTATIPGQGLVRAERADRQAGTVTVNGQEYKMIMLEPGGIRPRGGQQIVISQAVMGERGIGNYMAILAGGRVFVLPKNE